VVATFLAPIQLCRLDLERVGNSFYVLHIVKLHLSIHVEHLRVEVEVGGLAVEVVLLNHVHRVVVPTCQDIHVVRVLAVLPRPVGRHL